MRQRHPIPDEAITLQGRCSKHTPHERDQQGWPLEDSIARYSGLTSDICRWKSSQHQDIYQQRTRSTRSLHVFLTSKSGISKQ